MGSCWNGYAILVRMGWCGYALLVRMGWGFGCALRHSWQGWGDGDYLWGPPGKDEVVVSRASWLGWFRKSHVVLVVMGSLFLKPSCCCNPNALLVK